MPHSHIRQLPWATTVLALVLGAAPLQAQPTQGEAQPGVPELRQMLETAYQAQDHAAFLDAARRLHRLRPNNAEYMARLVVANALLGNRGGAYQVMLQMQQQGLAWDFDAEPDLDPVRGTEAYEHISRLLKIQGEPAGLMEPVARLPADFGPATSVAWDPSRESFLVGEARRGSVYAVSADGATRELLRANDENGLWSVTGLLVDAERGRLWIASAATRDFEGFDPVDAGRTALFEFELESLAPVARHLLPADGFPHRLGQMVQAPSGDIYVADGVLPMIYRLEAGADRPETFFASGQLVSLRGLALTPDGRYLYVADHEMGVVVMDLHERTARGLAAPENLNLGGIDGLAWWEGHLVVIQGGNPPQRVMRLKLDASQAAIESVAPLAVAQPGFDHPSYGAVVGEDLVFLADSRPDEGAGEDGAVLLARTSIANAPELQSPDIRKFMEDYEKSRVDEPPAALRRKD